MYLPYIILIASPSVYGKCSIFCTYGVWSEWTCKCNSPNQTRARSMCCPEGTASMEDCASVCNITLHYREQAPCTTCKNGGVFDQHSGRCKCPPTYSGTICCGKLEYQCLLNSSRKELLRITKSTLKSLPVVHVSLCDF